MLVERMRNDITRLTAVKAFDTVAASPLSLPLSPVLASVLSELTTFLRKANRPLRQAALSTIDVRCLQQISCAMTCPSNHLLCAHHCTSWHTCCLPACAAWRQHIRWRDAGALNLSDLVQCSCAYQAQACLESSAAKA